MLDTRKPQSTGRTTTLQRNNNYTRANITRQLERNNVGPVVYTPGLLCQRWFPSGAEEKERENEKNYTTDKYKAQTQHDKMTGPTTNNPSSTHIRRST